MQGEAKEVYRAGNGWLTYTPALHTLRESGTLIGLLDLLDERALRAGEAAVLAGLILDGGEEPLPDWHDDFDEFAAVLAQRVEAAGTGFDARLRRGGARLINTPQLLRVVRPGRLDALFASISTSSWVILIAIILFLAQHCYEPAAGMGHRGVGGRR